MPRTVVGVAANLCPVDAEGKNIHSSVSCRFAESIRQVGGLPLVIPVGDESVVRDYVEMQAHLDRWAKCPSSILRREKDHRERRLQSSA